MSLCESVCSHWLRYGLIIGPDFAMFLLHLHNYVEVGCSFNFCCLSVMGLWLFYVLSHMVHGHSYVDSAFCRSEIL